VRDWARCSLAERHPVHEMVRMTAADTLVDLLQVDTAALAVLTGVQVRAPVQHAAQHSGSVCAWCGSSLCSWQRY
jgi:hypothetical protein